MKVGLLFDRLCRYFLRGIRSIVSLRGLPQGGSYSTAGVSGNVCHLRLTAPVSDKTSSQLVPQYCLMCWRCSPSDRQLLHFPLGKFKDTEGLGAFQWNQHSALRVQNQLHLQATSAPADHWWSRHTARLGSGCSSTSLAFTLGKCWVQAPFPASQTFLLASGFPLCFAGLALNLECKKK